jgi:hypothetical protein
MDEQIACRPISASDASFNPSGILPYGLRVRHIRQAMNDFVDFLGFINQQLYTKQIPRLESFLMSANFSSIVGEFITVAIPKYCQGLVKNQYHNGHPDLLPAGMFPGGAAQHATDGIEIKGSRYGRGWQGHNPEAVWLMVFHFDSNTPRDIEAGIAAKPFRFKGVYAAQLQKEDWTYSGRSITSRRTITASVNKSGMEKMKANWVYRDSDKRQG